MGFYMITETGMDMIARTIIAEAQLNDAQFKAKLIELRGLGNRFSKEHEHLLGAIEDLDTKKKQLERSLKDNFKAWASTCNFLELRDQLQEQVAEMGKAGKKIEVVVDGLEIEFRKSKQPSYATGLNLAMSLLNEVTQNKYANLPELCKKDVAAIKTGIDILDKDLGDFSPELKELAKQRGVKVSSITFKADMKSFLQEVGNKIKSWFSKSISYFKGLFKTAEKNTETLEEFNSILSKLDDFYK